MNGIIINQHLNSAFFQLNNLANEQISIGTKNRIAKVIRTIQKDTDAFNLSHKDLVEKHKGKIDLKTGVITWENDIVPEEFNKEYAELIAEENTYTIDRIDYKRIEDIDTTFPYDFSEFSWIFENYNL